MLFAVKNGCSIFLFDYLKKNIQSPPYVQTGRAIFTLGGHMNPVHYIHCYVNAKKCFHHTFAIYLYMVNTSDRQLHDRVKSF